MPSKVSEAIEVLRSLPGDQQEAVARSILDYAAQDDECSSPMTKSRKFSAAQQIGTEEFFSVAEARRRTRHLDA